MQCQSGEIQQLKSQLKDERRRVKEREKQLEQACAPERRLERLQNKLKDIGEITKSNQFNKLDQSFSNDVKKLNEDIKENSIDDKFYTEVEKNNIAKIKPEEFAKLEYAILSLQSQIGNIIMALGILEEDIKKLIRRRMQFKN